MVYVAMWPIVMYSETVSIVTFLHSQTELISGMFLFKTVILYYYIYLYTINNDYTRYNNCSAWFLDIVISTCSHGQLASHMLHFQDVSS